MYEYSSRHERDRLLVAAIWLIGLGSVFLVQEMSGWGWDKAWPLFVVFVGACSAASALLDSQGWVAGLWAVSWPLAFMAVGIVLLLSTTGYIALTPADLWTLWPVALVALGIWFVVGAVVVPRRSVTDTLAIPLGGASSADVRIRFGGGELTVEPAPAGMLVNGTFQGGVEQRPHGNGRVELRPPHGAFPFWWDRLLLWKVGLTAEVPVDLRIDTGANRSTIDLSELQVRTLELKTGASETTVKLPRNGVTRMLAESGMASLNIAVPDGVAARIRSRMAIGSTNVDQRRFPRIFDGFASPDFDQAQSRVDIDIRGGIGAVTIS